MKIWPKRKIDSLPQAAETAPFEPPESSEVKERWIGFIDRIDRANIQGWCADRDNPSASIAVEAVGSKGGHAVTIASLFRRDVMEAGYGNGQNGFELNVSKFNDEETVTIRFVDGGHHITQLPIALDPIGALLSNALPASFLEAAQELGRQIQTRQLGQLQTESGAPPDCHYDKNITDIFDPATDPEGLITRFTAHEASRIVRNAFDLERTGSLQDRLAILYWYIDTYATGRPVSTRVPLSQSQVDALNAPARLAGASDAVTVALFNFVMRYQPSHTQLWNEKLLREAVFWWCTQQAVLHRLDDRLITDEQIALLATIEQGAGTQFPCTTFMLLYAQQHPMLVDLNLDLPRDRLALLSYLTLASFLKPSLLRFLPREALRRVVRGKGPKAFSAILGRLVANGDQADTITVGTDILRKGEALLAAAGQDLRLIRRARTEIPRSSSSPLEQGVCVLGPLTKSSGLGRAIRLSLDALTACETVAPVSYDFPMENPAPEEDHAAIGPTPEAPREITLMHLNAEALPLALAYGPHHLLEGTYRIGFFFWELTEIPDCHRLALDLVDEIWVASEFNRELYSRFTNKPVIRVGMAAVPLPDEPPAVREEWGLEPDAFTFIAVFDSLSFIARKNPLGLIEAFARAFPRGDEPVALLLKTQNRGIVQDEWQVRHWRAIDRRIAADPRITIFDETLAFAELLGLTRACDAFVSLHRSEGWGFGLIEAMQLGLPVVCTGWSGNADFCTDETAFLVAHRLILVGADEYIYTPRGSLWADPLVDSAATQLRLVVSDRAAAARKAKAARTFVTTELGLEATARRYGERLAAIRGGMRKASE